MSAHQLSPAASVVQVMQRRRRLALLGREMFPCDFRQFSRGIRAGSATDAIGDANTADANGDVDTTFDRECLSPNAR
jgi:hypothetical protein